MKHPLKFAGRSRLGTVADPQTLIQERITGLIDPAPELPIPATHPTSVRRTSAASVNAKAKRKTKGPQGHRNGHERWRIIGIRRSRDIRQLRPASLPRGERFETFQDALKNNKELVARLSRRVECLDLAAKIERCDAKAAPCSLPCCAICARRYRGYFFAELLRIANAYQGPHQIATIYLRAFSAGNLRAADINSAHESFRAKLRRAKLKDVIPEDVILVGGTEVAWLAKYGKWVLHLHLLAIGVSDAAWDRLRKALPDARPAAALKVQALEDFPEQLSYCQKFNSSHKPGRRGPNGRARAYPLPPERLVEWAEWMAKQRFEDFGFLFGARRHEGRIVIEA
jgi:hypothetical protein